MQPSSSRVLTLDAPTVLLRIAIVEARTGLKRSTIYRMIRDGQFPRPVHMSARATAWVESEVEEFIQAAIRQRDTVPLTPHPVVATPEPERWTIAQIGTWLDAQLADGQKARNDVAEAAYRRGIPWSLVKRTAETTGVRVEYLGEKTRKCYWSAR